MARYQSKHLRFDVSQQTDVSYPTQDNIDNIVAIRAKMNQSLTQNKNRAIVSNLIDKGSLQCLKEGIVPYRLCKSAEYVEAKVAKEKEKAERLAKDVPAKECITFTCHLTGKEYDIMSHKDSGDGNDIGRFSYVSTVSENNIERLEVQIDSQSTFVKRKHYFFYSKRPGYGKTSFLKACLQLFNASVVNDLHNWANVKEDAQFLLIDEYGHQRRLKIEDLTALTSGVANSIAGIKKSYGSSYVPRPDAQLIIFSTHHLFDCIGTYDKTSGRRMVSKQLANLLLDRFFIHKLDEEEGGMMEADDRAHFTDID